MKSDLFHDSVLLRKYASNVLEEKATLGNRWQRLADSL